MVTPEAREAAYRSAGITGDDGKARILASVIDGALEAAAPAIEAAAEKRFAAAAREELAKPLADLGAKITREATAAERERCARLAGQEAARWEAMSLTVGAAHALGASALTELAALIREQP